MIWYEDLFVGESIGPRKQKRIIRGIKKRRYIPRAYVLTLASNQENLIDIIPTSVLRQRHYPRKGLFVIGLAGDYEEAMLLAGKIVSGVYIVQGDFRLRAFFQSAVKDRKNHKEECRC